MSNIEAWQYLVALATPYLIALLNRPTWSATVKRWAMIAVAVVVAFVTQLLSGGFAGIGWGNLLVYLVAFIGVVQAAYTLLKSTPATAVTLDATEQALTPRPHDEQDRLPGM